MDEKKVLDNCSPDMAALQSHLQPMAPVKFTNNAMLEKMQGTLCVAAKFTQNENASLTKNISFITYVAN